MIIKTFINSTLDTTYDAVIRSNRLEWLAALESDKYKQARSRLKRQDDFGEAFCCLGIRCELFDPTLWRYEPVWEGPVFRLNNYSADTMPPAEITDLFGDKEQDSVTLASRNDEGWTFRQIAYAYRKDHDLWDGYTAQAGDVEDTTAYVTVKGADYDDYDDQAADTKPVE